jgi:hypothetical protein
MCRRPLHHSGCIRVEHVELGAVDVHDDRHAERASDHTQSELKEARRRRPVGTIRSVKHQVVDESGRLTTNCAILACVEPSRWVGTCLMFHSAHNGVSDMLRTKLDTPPLVLVGGSTAPSDFGGLPLAGAATSRARPVPLNPARDSLRISVCFAVLGRCRRRRASCRVADAELQITALCCGPVDQHRAD